ncbi:MAG: aspartate/glutamate racemase family protein [Ruminococcaceae bacterium]|mgnify:CR=1 FL=1|nr:aspartate/glutamate racemase family protein [Oscillospiraceae bacterium]
MKTIGLLGGMSWESTVTYYQVINTTVKEKLGGLHSARCIIFSVDFEEIERCQATGEWNEAGLVLQAAAQKLQQAGADFIVLCTNTMHKVAGAIQAGIGVPFLHMADVMAAALKQKAAKSAILLGTQYTMEQDFIKGPLEAAGINIITPNRDDRVEINRIIFEELCLGVVEEGSKQFILGVLSRLQGRGGEAVILGCTELGLLIGQQNCNVPVVDTALVHAKAAALQALEV